MNLLRDGIENESVQLTEQVVRLTVDGVQQNYPVYRIRLDNLYYNDQNDRIATWISQYKAENGDDSLTRDDLEHYNEVIHHFIENSNLDRLRQTQDNIKLLGQQKWGVVLNDGRIIDGNRRYTCLRNLSSEGESYNYFEAVILERDFERSAKQIKMLELEIQIGSEERVDYDPIDRLVGIYRDIEENELLTIQEYARSTNRKPNDVKKDLEIAKLIVEFLDAIKAPKKYYLARELQLDGPIRELYNALKRVNDEDSRQRLKYVAFVNLLMRPEQDMTRYIRNLGGIARSAYLEEFIDKEEELAEAIIDDLPDGDRVNAEVINKVRADEVSREDLRQTMTVFDGRVRIRETRDRPNNMLRDAISKLESIDVMIIGRLNDDEIDEMKANLDRLEELTGKIKEAVNV